MLDSGKSVTSRSVTDAMFRWCLITLHTLFERADEILL